MRHMDKALTITPSRQLDQRHAVAEQPVAGLSQSELPRRDALHRHPPQLHPDLLPSHPDSAAAALVRRGYRDG